MRWKSTEFSGLCTFCPGTSSQGFSENYGFGLSWSPGHGLHVTKEMGFLGLAEDTDGVPGLTGTGLTALF